MTDRTSHTQLVEADAMPDVLTVPEVARLLRVDQATVYRFALEGALPAGKVGRSWRFLRADVIAWLRRGGTATGSKQTDAQKGV